MKYYCTILIAILFTFSLNAQSTLPQGNRVPGNDDIYMSFGLGISSWGVPFYGSVEMMIHDEVSVGGELSFRSQSEEYGGYEYTHNAFSIAARGNYHFNHLLKIKPPFLFYAGATLGFVSVSTNDVNNTAYDGNRNSGLFFGLQTGGSYFFNKHWAATAELGIGNIMGLKLSATYLF